MSFRYLEQDDIFKLVDAAVEAGLSLKRPQLLDGADVHFVAGLALTNDPRSQLFQDLSEMNKIEALTDGSVPLKQWLKTATFLSHGRPQQARFQAAFEEVAARIDQGSASPPPEMLPESQEQVFHVDDRLDIGFFTRAVEASKRVARLVVPVFEGGQRFQNNRGEDVEGLGTGWLVGSGGLLMTNAHVIRARKKKHAEVEQVDLDAQIRGTAVEFGYEQGNLLAGQAPDVYRIKELVAMDKELDYALLQLDDAFPGMAPLKLQPRRIDLSFGGGGPDGKDYVPVNIIQHPDGRPKEAAFRNNLVIESGDLVLRYFTDTEGGSSGSPVCNDKWQVVALHRSTGKLGKVVNFQGKETAASNIGTQIAAILAHLESDAALWAKVEARLDVVG